MPGPLSAMRTRTPPPGRGSRLTSSSRGPSTPRSASIALREMFRIAWRSWSASARTGGGPPSRLGTIPRDVSWTPASFTSCCRNVRNCPSSAPTSTLARSGRGSRANCRYSSVIDLSRCTSRMIAPSDAFASPASSRSSSSSSSSSALSPIDDRGLRTSWVICAASLPITASRSERRSSSRCRSSSTSRFISDSAMVLNSTASWPISSPVVTRTRSW